MSLPIACLHHLPKPFTGYAGEAFRTAGLELDERHVSAGDPLPSLDAVCAVVAFGGYESLTELERYPYLLEEAQLLRDAVARDIPVLGICLGGQLLAQAFGGVVSRTGEGVPRWPVVTRLVDGDPVFGVLPREFETLHWNEDGFTLPPGGVEVLSAVEGDNVSAFRLDGARAWGTQFHSEMDPPAMAQLLAHAGLQGDPEDAGRQRENALALFGAFAALV